MSGWRKKYKLVLKLLHESFGWDSLFTVPQFDFYFKVALPRARKEREIIERDYLGRIVASKVPDLPYECQNNIAIMDTC